MSINIAGRLVKSGDKLYDTNLQRWGEVISVGGDSVQLEISGMGHNNRRHLTVTCGGMVNGRRRVYWHEPLKLDVPTSNIARIQAVLDTIIGRYGP